jgi:hypothetical protein
MNKDKQAPGRWRGVGSLVRVHRWFWFLAADRAEGLPMMMRFEFEPRMIADEHG